MTTTEFDTAFAAYLDHIRGLIDAYWTRNGFDETAKPTVDFTVGPKYIRVVKADWGDNRSVHSFVDKTNGDIHKGSWKAPVKNGKRGNIFGDFVGKVTEHGTRYLR